MTGATYLLLFQGRVPSDITFPLTVADLDASGAVVAIEPSVTGVLANEAVPSGVLDLASPATGLLATETPPGSVIEGVQDLAAVGDLPQDFATVREA